MLPTTNLLPNKDTAPRLAATSILGFYSRQAGSLLVRPPLPRKGDRSPTPVDRAMRNKMLVQILDEVLELSR